MNKVRLGVVGFGNMGTTHCRNVVSGKVPDMELTAICDCKEDRREAAQKHYPDVAVFDNATEMYQSGLCDVVIIATPHYDHVPLAKEAFGFGLNVICEKPIGVYTKQALEINEAAKKSGKLFGIMYNVRTNPVYQKIRELVQSGELGAIKRISWVITNWYRTQAYHDSCAWRSTWKTEGGGVLINQNPHQLDLWQWMFGMPDRIMAFASFAKYRDIEVEDDVTAYFEYDNGITGTYITSSGEAPGTNRLEIACDRGRLVVEDNKITFDRNVIEESEFNKTNQQVFGIPECWKCEIPVKGSYGQHVGILQDYTKVLLNGGELLAPGYDGIKGLTISNAMHYSAWTGKKVDLHQFPHDEFYELLQEKIANSSVVKSIENEKTVDTDGTYK